MKKRIISILTAATMIFSLLPMSIFAVDAVSYIDAGGATQSCTDYTIVTDADEDVTWNGGTYVVSGADVVIDGEVSLEGDVKLILCDGAKLTVNSCISGSYKLEIFGQENQSGLLTVWGGISCDDVIINGGDTYADSYDVGCGVYCSNFTANGGVITALGVPDYYSGIGILASNTINITGGVVKAVGGGGPDIAYGGSGVECNNITISGGVVEFIGGYGTSCGHYGINTGMGKNGTLTVSGGTVNISGSVGMKALYSKITVTTDQEKVSVSNDGTTYPAWNGSDSLTDFYSLRIKYNHDLSVMRGNAEAINKVDYEWGSDDTGKLIIKKSGLTVSGMTEDEYVEVAEGVTDLTIKDLSILAYTSVCDGAILFNDDGTLTVLGSNSLENEIGVLFNGSGTITGNGDLYAHGGHDESGLYSGGDLILDCQGTIIAEGGALATGIVADGSITVTANTGKILAYTYEDCVGAFWTSALTLDPSLTMTASVSCTASDTDITSEAVFDSTNNYITTADGDVALSVLIVHSLIEKEEAQAPAAGVGYTISYAWETITVESGYEVSKSNDSFKAETLTDNKLVVEPGATYYIRKAADAGHYASEATSFTTSARPAAPKNSPALVGKTDTTITVAASQGHEYSIDNGSTWVYDGGAGDGDSASGTITFTGLEQNSKYSIVSREKARISSFAGAISSPSVITTKSTEESKAAAEPVDVIDNKIVSSGKKLEIKDTEGKEVASEKIVAVADAINAILDNAKVKSFGKAADETGLIAATEVKNNEIVDALKAKTSDSVAKGNVTDTDINKYLNVIPVSANVNIDTDDGVTVTVEKLVFDVTPYATITVSGSDGQVKLTTEISNSQLDGDVTFLLPVDKNKTALSAALYHEDEFLDNYPIKSDSDCKYIEVTTDSFSEFGYILLDETTAGAKIDSTYYASLSDAVTKVVSGQSIYLLRNASGTIKVSREITFTVEPNGKTNNASIVAGSGYMVSRSGNTYTISVYVGGDDDVSYTKTDKILKYFGDIPSNRYFYEPVLWAAKEGIALGVDEKCFDPFGLATRAQMVTFIWRAVGCPKPSDTTCRFNDLLADEYYYDAVLWALENGVAKGTTETTFSPDENVTRGQAVAFLARLSNVQDEAAGYSHGFTDVSKEDYFYNAVAWASKKKIANGFGGNEFLPNEDCQRSEIVTFLYRYFVK